MVLFAATRLRVGARRLRALARGDAAGVRDFVQNDSARRLAEARRDARRDLESMQAAGAYMVTMADAAYPNGLHELADPPAYLCVRGALPEQGVAVIGTRTPTEASGAYAHQLASLLRVPIVSGLALGIDAAAHRGALAAGMPTIAYVATGIARTYPPEHVELADDIVAAGGAVASECLPDAGPAAWTFVRRDRLQAAHAAAVVLVQSELDGGAMHAMEIAVALGRNRFALLSNGEAAFAGNALAISCGAGVLSADPALAACAIAHVTK